MRSCGVSQLYASLTPLVSIILPESMTDSTLTKCVENFEQDSTRSLIRDFV